MENDNDKVFWECGPGWSKVISPLVERISKLGGTVVQVKEKFGGLRLYFTPAEADSIAGEAAWAALQDDVDQAERDSYKICEICGKPGVLMTSGTWLKTVCPEHALELGYKKRVTR